MLHPAKLAPPITFWAFLCLIGMVGLFGPSWPLGGAARLWQGIGCGFVLAGGWLLWATYIQIKRSYADACDAPVRRRLITTGPFAWSRNPMYLGLTSILLGSSMITGSWLAMPLAPLFWLDTDRTLIPFEEESAAITCGDRYQTYAQNVRRWL